MPFPAITIPKGVPAPTKRHVEAKSLGHTVTYYANRASPFAVLLFHGGGWIRGYFTPRDEFNATSRSVGGKGVGAKIRKAKLDLALEEEAGEILRPFYHYVQALKESRCEGGASSAGTCRSPRLFSFSGGKLHDSHPVRTSPRSVERPDARFLYADSLNDVSAAHARGNWIGNGRVSRSNSAMLTKVQSNAIVQAYAISQYAKRHNSGASIKVQQRLQDKFSKLLNAALDRAGVRFATDEFMAQIESAANAWLGTQAIRGPGRWW